MSWYTNFFVRSRHDDFVEIASFSRSHMISQYFPHVPVEKIVYVDDNDLEIAKDEIKRVIQNCKNCIEQLNKFDEELRHTEALSVSERHEAWFENERSRDEYRETIAEAEWSLHVLEFFSDVCNLYVGDEISNPTVDDILKTDTY